MLKQFLIKTIETNSGIYVATVNRGGPAYNAGLMVGDIILTVNGIEINKMNELREYIYNKAPGEQLQLKVLRKDVQYDFSVTLGRR